MQGPLYWRVKELIDNMEGDSMNDLRDTDAMDLIEFANEWSDLGSMIQPQVSYVINHDFEKCEPEDFDHDEVNPNAIKQAQEHLIGYNDEIDQAFADYWALIDFTKKQELIAGAIEDDPGEDGEESTIIGTERR